MRIALFTDADVFAGTEQHMLDLACGLRDLQVEPFLACPFPSPLAQRAAQRQIDVIRIGKRGAIDWRAVRTLSRLLNDHRIDIIHAHNGRTSILAALAVAMARRGHFVATQHFLHPARTGRSGPRAMLSSCLHRWVGRRAQKLIAVSQAARREMLARGDAPSDHITVIPPGISQSRSPDLATDKQEARHALGIGPDVPMVLCAARLEPEKDVISLVRAMARVAKENPTALCVVAGEGSERAKIEREIARLQLTKHVQLLGFCQQMSQLMASCDLLVLPSLAEPFGLVLLEAMAHGRPVVATRAGGPPEIVCDGETGLLVRPGEPNELAGAMLRLLADKQLGEKMGLSGWNRARNFFSISRMAQATVEVYTMAVASVAADVPD